MLGKQGEQIARKYLQKKGYEFVFANYRTRWGEIDLIMRDDEGIVFVEVKTRHVGNTVAPNDRLSENKIARLEKAANIYLMNQPEQSWRFLLVSVTKQGERFVVSEKLF